MKEKACGNSISVLKRKESDQVQVQEEGWTEGNVKCFEETWPLLGPSPNLQVSNFPIEKVPVMFITGVINHVGINYLLEHCSD